jgi:hypothetical protein
MLFPLDSAYEHLGLAAPKAQLVAADRLPSPYRSLLAHDGDMTTTLERHFGGRLCLRTLSTSIGEDWYQRRVLLAQEHSGRPVEMGVLRTSLAPFSAGIRAEILRGREPFGRILRRMAVNFVSRPLAFLAITPNSELMGLFWMREPVTLYGRKTEVMVDGKKIGDIVEVLPRL